ncbi:MAG: hypothetical protein ACU84J_13865 [Gammaproteobacteria bacterium]
MKHDTTRYAATEEQYKSEDFNNMVKIILLQLVSVTILVGIRFI